MRSHAQLPVARRAVSAAAAIVVAGSIAACGEQPSAAESGAESAAEEIVIVRLELVDTTRTTAATPTSARLPTRTLVTTVYLPPATGPAPLIVLAHGAAGSPEKFTDLANFWAAHGYVVAVPRFPLTNDTIVPTVLGDFVQQARDVRFVIDQVRTLSAGTGDLGGRVDAERIGLYGLSLGSMTMWSEVADPSSDIEVDALIQSDGITLLDDAALASVAFPVLVMHSDLDPIFPYADVLRRYDALGGPKYLLTMHGAAHATVGENTVTPADEPYRQATAAFWDRTLGDATTAPFPADIVGVTTFVEGARTPAGPLPGTL